MRATMQGRAGAALRLAALCAAAAAPLAAAARPLTFDGAFDRGGGPPGLHFRASFVSRGAEHRLEVWRDGDRRVRRRTDDAVETYAFREAAGPEYRLSVLDLKRKLHTRVDRTSLYRLGSFTDWFELAHALRHPRGAYRLTRLRTPPPAPRPLDRCDWYELAEGGRSARICWSARDGIPLVVLGADGEASWWVTALDRAPLPAGTFEIHDDGFVRNDASADLEGD